MGRSRLSKQAPLHCGLCLLQTVVSVVLVATVAWKLIQANPGRGTTRCLLDGADRNGATHLFCVYAIFVGLITLFVICAVACFSLVTCNLCGATHVAMDTVADAGLLAWWLVASVLFFLRGLAAGSVGFPERRTRLVAMICVRCSPPDQCLDPRPRPVLGQRRMEPNLLPPAHYISYALLPGAGRERTVRRLPHTGQVRRGIPFPGIFQLRVLLHWPC
jgi:hypothetical protein